MHIHRFDQNKSASKSIHRRSQGVSKTFRALIYKTHRAVIFAIAQLSCLIPFCGKSVSKITYFVSSVTLNLNSINSLVSVTRVRWIWLLFWIPAHVGYVIWANTRARSCRACCQQTCVLTRPSGKRCTTAQRRTSSPTRSLWTSWLGSTGWSYCGHCAPTRWSRYSI